MRLIDADEALKKISALFNYRIVEFDDIKRIVDNMPTVEQKHGHWIREGGLKRAGEPEAHSGNYEPSNCRWVSMAIQNANKG